MEDRVEISMLMDIYGSLLTEKQLDIMDIYYNDDLSLSEIAEFNNTSRQAIHDILKRCYKILTGYESKLHILKKNIERHDKIENIIKDIDKKYALSEEDKNKLKLELENL